MLLEDTTGRTRIEQVPQSALYLHCTIFLADAQHTELGDETFRLVDLQGQESISTPFEFKLTLHGNSVDPRSRPLVFKDLLGRRVSFGIARPPIPAVTRAASTSDSARKFRTALRGGAVSGLIFPAVPSLTSTLVCALARCST